MPDKTDIVPASDNIRSLIYFLGLSVDYRMAQMRRKTPYARVRASDVRVFVDAARNPTTISGIARQLQISRQAAQLSVGRLQKLGVVELVGVAGNRRDKQVVVTPRGQLASLRGTSQITEIEQEFEKILGPEAWTNLLSSLKLLVQASGRDRQKSTLML